MIQFLILMNRQGKIRLTKWYTTYSTKERSRIQKEISPLVLSRNLKLCNFLDWRDSKLVFKSEANELICLETIHLLVEVLDRYFGNVCELDLIFNFHKAYYILDELVLAGELQESSKKAVIRAIETQELFVDQHRQQLGQA